MKKERTKKFRFNHIYSRLLFFNILLIVVATIVPQFILYKYFTERYGDKLEEINYYNICQVRDFVDETIFEPVIGISVTHFSDRFSNDLLINPTHQPIRDESYTILQISSRLYEIQESYSFVNQIDLYYPFNQLLFRGSHVFFLDQGDVNARLENQWLQSVITSEESLLWMPVSQGNSACIYARSIPYFNSDPQRRAMLVIEIKTDALVQAMEKTRTSPAGAYSIVSSQGQVIAGIQPESLQFSPAQDWFKSISQQPGDGFFKCRQQGAEYIVSYASSSYNNWKFISLVPIDDVFSGMTDIKVWLLTLCSILICFNVLFAVLITKRAHSPMAYIIENIQQVANRTDTAEEQNQYRLLENTFHSLMFQVEDLKEHLTANQPIIYHNMVKRILSPNNPSLEYDSEIIGFSRPFYAAFLVKIRFGREYNAHSRILVNYSVNDLFHQHHDAYEIYSITDEKDLIYGILNFDQLEEGNTIAPEIKQQLETILSVPFTLCLGPTTDQIDQLPDSYQKAREGERYSFFCPHKTILSWNWLCTLDLKPSGTMDRYLKKVTDDIRNRDWNQLKDSIETIIESFCSNLYSIDYRENTLTDLVSAIRKAALSAGYDESAVWGSDIREQLKNIVDIDDFRKWMEQILQQLQDSSAKTEDSVIDWKKKIENYVEENLFHDVSLVKMSEDLGISSSYLSRIFKSIMGVNYSDYLVEKKLLRAKELLDSTDYTVKEISEMLGYASTAHFIRIFKQRYGCTPKQSRMNKMH